MKEEYPSFCYCNKNRLIFNFLINETLIIVIYNILYGLCP